MRTLFVLLITYSVALADSAMIDADGRVIAAAKATLLPDTDCTVVIVPDLATISSKDPLVDSLGRCRWTAVAGQRPTKLAVPEWSKGALKNDQAKRLRDKADALLMSIVALERWQSDPANVSALDRQAELDDALAQLVTLRNVLAGR